jgi:protein-disulfide isomerase
MTSTPSGRDSRQAKIAAAAPPDPGRNRLVFGVLLALVIVGSIVAAITLGSRTSPTATSAATGTSVVPPGASGMGEGVNITTGTLKAGAPTLDIYEDFQCPICKEVHAILGTTTNELAASGDAKVVYHVLSFLDDNFKNSFSKPVANAAMCAAPAGKFREFHDAAFEGQTKEGQDVPAAALDGFAAKAGITGSALDAWKTCRTANTYATYIASVQDAASRAGVTGTPTYRLNGTEIKWTATPTPDALKQAVAAATKK